MADGVYHRSRRPPGDARRERRVQSGRASGPARRGFERRRASRVGRVAPRRDSGDRLPPARGRAQLRDARLGLPLRHLEAARAGRALHARRSRSRGHVPRAPHVPGGALPPRRRARRSARARRPALVATAGRHRPGAERLAGDGDRRAPRPPGAPTVRLARRAPRRRPPGAQPGVDRPRPLRDGRRAAGVLRRRIAGGGLGGALWAEGPGRSWPRARSRASPRPPSSSASS